MQIRTLIVFFSFMLLTMTTLLGQKASEKHVVNLHWIDSVAERYLEQSKMVGVAGSIIIDGKIVWMKGYGFADKENKIPYTEHTSMNIASITKTMVGVCMMRLVEEKKLSLDADINTYLPFKVVNPYYPNEKITLRMIATHSSSLADREPFYSDSTYFTEKDSPEPLGAFLKEYYVPGGKHYSDSNFYKAKPGAYWEYSNIAAGLAGYIVERISGKKLNEYSRSLILNPLGMKNSTWFLSETDRSKHAKLYYNKGDSSFRIPLYAMTTYPDGGLRTSVSDLSQFFAMLLKNGTHNGKRILQTATVNDMQTLQFTAKNKPANMNLAEKNEGIFWRTKNDVTLLGHGGRDRGVKTLMLTDMNKKVGVILFTNTEDDNNKRTDAYYLLFDILLKYALELKK